MARIPTLRALVLVCAALVVLHYADVLSPITSFLSFSASFTHDTCPPSAWASGHWEHRPRPRIPGTNESKLERTEDIFHYNGLHGCAADREFYWHLAADRPEQFNRFPNVTEQEWVPGPGCRGVAPLTPEGLVKHLVEEGGWLVLGDSVTENHFFSLSCTLFPHVLATPNYTENPYFDRAWPQNLYLNPDSPLVQTLSLPDGFSVAETPLVTFRRIDLLLTRDELEALHRAKHPDMYEEAGTGPGKNNFTLLSDEQFWSHSPKEYMDWFTAPAPMRYKTLLTNTGGHWTTTLLRGFRDDEAEGQGIQGVLGFFGEAMDRWAREMQALMDRERAKEEMERDSQGVAGIGGAAQRWRREAKPFRREVVVRAYLPGHEDCHDWRTPWDQFHPEIAFRWKWYNWAWIGEMNTIFERVLSSSAYPDIHFLPIDRPGLLRPDGHGSGDCLHLMTGTGVMEGWTRYVWHYVSHELAGP